MGVNKDTKIFYQHSCEESDFTGSLGGGSTYTYRNKADDADITKTGMHEVLKDITSHHTKDPNAKDSYPETILALKTYGNVADAKAGMIHADVLAAFDTHCDRQEWALVDGNKGLKMTRDWKIEYDASADDHYKQFKDAMDSRWASGTYGLAGAFLVDSTDHIF